MNAVDELNFLLGIGPPRPQLPITLQRSGYTAVRTLGKGSFGQALLVFHKARQTYYVVKHVNMTNMNARQRKDAHNEISVLQQLHHPNIVRYEECFEEPPHLYIVMEYADGGDVFSHLEKVRRRRPFRSPLTAAGDVKSGAGADWLTEAQVISLFVQTTMAVKYMHDRRLLHRDIKSQNVFLTKQHVVKLGDFGITMVLQNTVAMASTMCGTPCYFSPELCLGKPYNNKSDVWALGVLLYELCAGHVPFESTTMKSLMREIVNKEPPRIPTCFSNELWDLVQWMLQKDPKKRPDAGQVLHTPVLMRHVPDIIAQLEQAHSLSAEPEGAGAGAGVGGGAASPTPPLSPTQMARRSSQARDGSGEPASSPYYQLLQQPAGKAHAPAVSQGRNPFASGADSGVAPRRASGASGGLPVPPSAAGVDPTDATREEEAYIAAYRRRLQEKQQQQQQGQQQHDQQPLRAKPEAGKVVAAPSAHAQASPSTSATPASAAAAAGKSKPPTFSPQLRAALSKDNESNTNANNNNNGGGPDSAVPPPPPQRGVMQRGSSGVVGGVPAAAASAAPPSTSAPSSRSDPLPAAAAAAAAAAAGREERPSIEALLARFDQEKKRVQDEKQQERDARQQKKQQHKQSPAPSSSSAQQRGAAPSALPNPATSGNNDSNGNNAKKPRPLSVADQEDLMTKQAAAAATNALGMLRTPSVGAGHPTQAHSHPAPSPPPAAAPGPSTTTAATEHPAAAPATSPASNQTGGDLTKMMKEMNAYFHRYEQRRQSGPEPASANAKNSSPVTSAAPTATASKANGAPDVGAKVMAAAVPAPAPAPAMPASKTNAPTPLAPPKSPAPPPQQQKHAAAAVTSPKSPAARSPSRAGPTEEDGKPGIKESESEALFDDPTGACLDIVDIQKQHDAYWQQRSTPGVTATSSARAGSKASPPRRSPESSASNSNTPAGPLHPTAPHEAFMSSLNRKYQHVASVNAMAAAPSNSGTGSPTLPLSETPSPPPNRMLASSSSAAAASGRTGGAQSAASSARAQAGSPNPNNKSSNNNKNKNVHEDAVAPLSAADSTESPTAALDLPFRGQCLCAAVQLSGWFSTIYGSFVCNCQACCRLSGSTLGVEWLHLPNVSSMNDILAISEEDARRAREASVTSDTTSAAAGQPRAPGAAQGPVGSGVAAVTALQQQQQQQQQQREGSVPADRATRAYRFELLVDADEDDDEEMEDGDGGGRALNGSRGPQYVASFWTHFCSCCGATVGFQHDGLDGVLLPKTILDEESEAVLRRFARTVAPGGDGDEDDVIE